MTRRIALYETETIRSRHLTHDRRRYGARRATRHDQLQLRIIDRTRIGQDRRLDQCVDVGEETVVEPESQHPVIDRTGAQVGVDRLRERRRRKVRRRSRGSEGRQQRDDGIEVSWSIHLRTLVPIREYVQVGGYLVLDTESEMRLLRVEIEYRTIDDLLDREWRRDLELAHLVDVQTGEEQRRTARPRPILHDPFRQIQLIVAE